MKKILVLLFCIAFLQGSSQTVDKYFGNRIFNLNNRMTVFLNGTDTVYRQSKLIGTKFFGRLFINNDSIPTVTDATGHFVQLVDETTGQFKKITAANLGGGSADGNGIYGGSGSLSGNTDISGGGNNLNIGTSGSALGTAAVHAGFFNINSSTNFKMEFPTDDNFSVTTSSCVIYLPAITSNRTLSLPATARAGMLYIIINTNNSGNTWNFGGGGSLLDNTGGSVTSFANNSTYILIGHNPSPNHYRIVALYN